MGCVLKRSTVMPVMQLCLFKEPEKVMLQNLMANKADGPVGSFTHDTNAYR